MKRLLLYMSMALGIICICWILYLHFFVYFDAIMTPRQQLVAYWQPSVLAFIGFIIHVFSKEKW